MGEIAQDMVNGCCCQSCGLYFEKDGYLFCHGYPVVCKVCFDPNDDSQSLLTDVNTL